VSLVEVFATKIKEIKRSMLLSGVNQGIKTNSERLISTNQLILSDTEAWQCFVL